MPSSRGIFPTEGCNPGLLHCKERLYWLSHQRSHVYIYHILYSPPYMVFSFVPLAYLPICPYINTCLVYLRTGSLPWSVNSPEHYSWMCQTMHVQAKSLLSCLTLCDPVDCSPPGSSAHRILQARILERVAIFYFRGSYRPSSQTRVSYLLHWQVDSWLLAPPGKTVSDCMAH